MEVMQTFLPHSGRNFVPPLKRVHEESPEEEGEGGIDHLRKKKMYYRRRNIDDGVETSQPPKDSIEETK
ncbi:hypothetical protein KI387_012850, partial [Taxus chinensis]